MELSWKNQTFRVIDWEEWVDLCEHYNEDPYETDEIDIDTGGGSSDILLYIGDTPKRED